MGAPLGTVSYTHLVKLYVACVLMNMCGLFMLKHEFAGEEEVGSFSRFSCTWRMTTLYNSESTGLCVARALSLIHI